MTTIPGDEFPDVASIDEADEYRLENDSRFLKRVAEAREEFKAGKAIPLEEVKRILRVEQ